jgi:hypothetical protein
MAEQAYVTSIAAIDLFRSGLIQYLSKTKPVLEDAIDDVFRTRQWLQHDRRIHWENQLKRRRKALEEAEQAVFSARIASLREVSSAENAAVLRCKRAVTEAEDKLRIIKRWTLEFDSRVEPLVKQLEQLRTVLGNTMPKGIAHLANVVKVLDAYANTSSATAGVPPAVVPADANAEPEAAKSELPTEEQKP